MVALVDLWSDQKKLSPRDRLVAVALWFSGTLYEMGGKSAKALDGVQVGGNKKLKPTDCSGLVRAVYSEVFPESGLDCREDLNALKFKTLDLFENPDKPGKGDIICWNSHIGIVSDPDKRIMIHAPGAGKPVRRQDWKFMPANPLFRSWKEI